MMPSMNGKVPEMLANVREVQFPVKGDERGKLVIQEALSGLVPFEIKRTFFIFDTTPGTIRGRHAHYRNRQLLICVSGACTISCEMPDGSMSSYRLDWPDKGLLVEGLVWHEMKEFSKDAVLLVLSSEHYNESDYIRSHEDFMRIAASGGAE